MAGTENLDYLLGEIFESVGDIKKALADGHMSVDEIVGAIPDEATREYLRRLFGALRELPAEVGGLAAGGPWAMIGLLQSVATRVMALFK